jgi:transposase
VCRWLKKTAGNPSVGRSCGGFSTKIHAVCDALGNPVRFTLTAGERSDYTEALNLLEGLQAGAVLADKGYDADYVIDRVQEMEAIVVIPGKKNRRTQRLIDRELYKERNCVERLFNRLKNFRRVATRYDKLDSSFMGFVAVASIYLWLK